jgi:hypothetical protein
VREPIQRLLRGSWPRGFAVAQFPNAPLIAAIFAGIAGQATHGSAHRLALTIFYLALGVWSYAEAIRGDNWLRRLLGLGIGVYVVVRLNQHLRA